MTASPNALLKRISTLAEQMGLAKDHASIYRALFEVAKAATPADSLLVSHLDPSAGTRRHVYAAGRASGTFHERDVGRGPSSSLATSPQSRAIAEQRAIIVDELDEAYVQHALLGAGGQLPRSCIAMPLVVLGDVIGAFELQSVAPAAFREEHVVELRMAANLAAIATRNLHLHERQEEALAQVWARKKRLRAVLEQAPALTATVEGPEHVFTYANQKYQQLFAGRDIIGRRVVDAIPEVQAQGIIDLLDRVYQTGESYANQETAIELNTGEGGALQRHYFDLVYQAIRDDKDQVIGVLAQAVDITSQVEARRHAEGLHRALQQSYDRTIEGWARALDLKDEGTAGHSQRVARLTVALARRMGVSEDELVHVRRGALLHDIGKMAVPDRILHKPGELDPDEWEIMRRHTTDVYDFLFPIEHLRPAIDIPRYHHERWDGGGYPHGLAGERIPMAARIFAVVDFYDAITSDRPYRAHGPTRVH